MHADAATHPVPMGFQSLSGNIGIRDGSPDILVIASRDRCNAAGVFTQSRFAGPSVQLSRDALAALSLRGIVVVSKNANVANGKGGTEDAVQLTHLAADMLACDWRELAVASTGVIGRRYPMSKVEAFFKLPGQRLGPLDPVEAARAIMTTDTFHKIASIAVGDCVILGIAKGVGMIEPDMATLLTFFFTDAYVERDSLDVIFRRVCEKTFNSISIDTDTSTSDTAIIMASGDAGSIESNAFEQALLEVATGLVKMLARDGEGATKLIEVGVAGARDYDQAKRVAKSIVNSPLVKTAVHGADPNWGRVAMAIGKCSQDVDIDPETVSIGFGELEVYPGELSAIKLRDLATYMKGDEVKITVELAVGSGCATVWGCDLSAEYVSINGDYST